MHFKGTRIEPKAIVKHIFGLPADKIVLLLEIHGQQENRNGLVRVAPVKWRFPIERMSEKMKRGSTPRNVSLGNVVITDSPDRLPTKRRLNVL